MIQWQKIITMCTDFYTTGGCKGSFLFGKASFIKHNFINTQTGRKSASEAVLSNKTQIPQCI